MTDQELQSAMNRILDAVRTGNKIQAIKEFHKTFGCGLKEAKEAIEDMDFGRNNDWKYYKNIYSTNADHVRSYGDEPNQKKHKSILPIIILLVLLVPGILIFFMTDIFLPQQAYYSISVQLENGETFETDLSIPGALNKKNEFSIPYSSMSLVQLIGLYLGDYVDIRDLEEHNSANQAWIISDSENPYYDGKIQNTNSNIYSYVSSETVYDSVTKTHKNDIYYNNQQEVVWEYDAQKEEINFPQTVIETSSFNGESKSNLKTYFNVNQFMSQKYGINIEIIYDKSNKLVIFKVPKMAEVLPDTGQTHTEY